MHSTFNYNTGKQYLLLNSLNKCLVVLSKYVLNKRLFLSNNFLCVN